VAAPTASSAASKASAKTEAIFFVRMPVPSLFPEES
jgi:hypothetical protein